VLRLAQRGPQLLIGGRVVVVAVDIVQQAGQLSECSLVHPAVFLQAVVRPRFQLLQRPARLGDADDWHVQVAAFDHGLQRREDLLIGQVATRAEEHKRIGL
jgi:hypothetical protein